MNMEYYEIRVFCLYYILGFTSVRKVTEFLDKSSKTNQTFSNRSEAVIIVILYNMAIYYRMDHKKESTM